MCYTSGTTGNPKGVAYSHRSVRCTPSALQADGCRRGLAARHRHAVVPMFHANAWGLPYAATMVGAKQVFPDR